MPKRKPSVVEKSVQASLDDLYWELHSLMKQAHFTQKEMAKVLGISIPTMSVKMNNPGTFTLAEFTRAKLAAEMRIKEGEMDGTV